MSEWQPIETAPRDGSEVLCLAPEYNGPVMLEWFRYNGLAAWRDWELDVYNPTHWLPLPPPSTSPSTDHDGEVGR